jgi:hypothetical protein
MAAKRRKNRKRKAELSASRCLRLADLATYPAPAEQPFLSKPLSVFFRFLRLFAAILFLCLNLCVFASLADEASLPLSGLLNELAKSVLREIFRSGCGWPALSA